MHQCARLVHLRRTYLKVLDIDLHVDVLLPPHSTVAPVLARKRQALLNISVRQQWLAAQTVKLDVATLQRAS